jgi:hypothetical protein
MTILPNLSASRSGTRVSRWQNQRLALAAVAGPVLFTVAWAVLGLISDGYTLFGTRIAPYSSVHQPISGLGLGGTAVFMNTAFVLTGALLVIGVFGALGTTSVPVRARRSCAALLSLTGVGVATDGAFTLEAMLPHSIGFLLAVAAPAVSFPVAGRYLRRLPGWRGFGTWLMIAAPITLLLVVLFFATFTPTAEGAQHGIAGLVQRILVTEVLASFAALGILAQRTPATTPTAAP